MKQLFVVLAFIALIIGGYWLVSESPASVQPGSVSFQDAAYMIDGQRVQLTQGVSEVEAAPGSASKIVTRYFGNDATGDLNGDGVDDTAFILTQTSGGSGTFYYVVAAIKTESGYTGSDAVLLGDRIAPQTTEIRNGTVIANYADRKPGESFADQPSVGKSIVLKLDTATMQFGEVVQNFEGEADPSVMTLDMHAWNWIQTTSETGTVVVPKSPKFTLTFKPDNTFSATTDCNGVGGEYAVKGSAITFGKMMSTLMFCDGSQEAEFTQMLGSSTGFRFTAKGELVLTLNGGGEMTLR